MSILDEKLNPITEEALKKLGFEKQPWGSPDYYSTESSDISKRRIYLRDERRVGWRPTKYMWVIDTPAMTAYYFPEKFEGYVNIQGLPCTPKNSLAVGHTWGSEKMTTLTDVQDMMDIEAVLSKYEYFE
jgi:hypothetical protein